MLEAAKLLQAMKYFQEANVLDRERPDILAWLTICAVELGLVQVAKQGIRVVVLWVQRDEAFSRPRLQVVGSYKDLLFHFCLEEGCPISNFVEFELANLRADTGLGL